MSTEQEKSRKSTNFENLKNINRRFSESFKRQKVEDLLAHRITVQQVSNLYEVTRSAVYKWIYKYSNLERGTKMVIEMESESQKSQALQVRVAELERIIGQKQIEIDYLSKTLELASEEIGYDLKKKYATKSWSGLENKVKG